MLHNFVLLSCLLVFIELFFHLEVLLRPGVLNLAMAHAVIVDMKIYHRVCKPSAVDSLHFKLCWIHLSCFNQYSDVLH